MPLLPLTPKWYSFSAKIRRSPSSQEANQTNELLVYTAGCATDVRATGTLYRL